MSVSVYVGTGAGKTESFAMLEVAKILDEADYVVLRNGEIVDREDLWARLKQSLLEAVQSRRKKPKKSHAGRRKTGPGGVIGLSRAAIEACYRALRGDSEREVTRTEVYETLGVSRTTLYRVCRAQNIAWPPC